MKKLNLMMSFRLGYQWLFGLTLSCAVMMAASVKSPPGYCPPDGGSPLDTNNTEFRWARAGLSV